MNNNFLKDKRILITHPFLYEINGATNAALELAQYLQASHAKVRVYTNVFENPIKQFFEKSKIQVDVASSRPKYHFKDFDYIWVNSQTFPVSLLEELEQKTSSTNLPKIIFMHMSAHEYCADEMPYIYKFEENLSSLSLFVSEEALQVNKQFFEKLPHYNFYRNPAPTAYNLIKRQDEKLKKLLIVSNHPCQELSDIREPLKRQNIIVDHLGALGDRYTMINEKILSEYDAIISIGKTVQYCLVSGTPVYVYDKFGGPGWLNENNFLKARKKNFSGRGFQTKTPEIIIQELVSGYQDAITYYSTNKLKFQKKYSIGQIIPNLFRQAESQRKKILPLTKANIAAHRSLLRLVEIDFNKWYDTFSLLNLYKDQEAKIASIKKENTELKSSISFLTNDNAQLSEIANSRSVKTWLKFNDIIKHKRPPKPEIILTMCIYNEELNLQKFLKYVEKYIDGIVVVDDNSSDNTAKIIKNHPKTLSIINTKNPHKDNSYNERGMREQAIKEVKRVAKSPNPFVLCIDPDERPEKRFLQNLHKLANKYNNRNKVITLHYRELWGSPNTWRCDGIWGQKIRPLFFQLSDNMTFSFKHQYHVPWAYDEIVANQELLDYNIYHLKMIKNKDREDRKNLYNSLDPNLEIQNIGYDYLNDKKGLKLQKIVPKHKYDLNSVPQYYKDK